MNTARYLFVVLLGLALSAPVGAQFGLPRAPRVPSVPGVGQVEIPGLDDLIAELLREEPPLTTSLADALEPAPELDDYDPGEFENGHGLGRDEEGNILMPPGAWEFRFESFCLRPGTRGPGAGDGYLLAPAKGKAAGPIVKILRNNWRHPEIEQWRVQLLLWAIESRRPLHKVAPEVREVAELLLSPEEIRELSRTTFFDQISGATGLDESVLRKVLARMPADARAPFEAQAKIYRLMDQRTTPFADIERLAVLPAAPPEPDDVPRGRWSVHPDGYFVRYLPRGYRQTTVQMLVPSAYSLERDALGRIIAIETDGGYRVETEYNDAIAPAVLPAHPDMPAYAFKTIRYINYNPEDPAERWVEEFHDVGWTFVGEPNWDALPDEPPVDVAAARVAPVAGPTFATWTGGWGGGLFFAQAPNVNTGPFPDSLNEVDHFVREHNRRSGQLKKPYKEMKKWEERRKEWDPEGKDAFKDVTDMDHYKEGLKEATGNNPQGKGEWIGKHINRVKRAWERAIDELRGGQGTREEAEKKAERDRQRTADKGLTPYTGGDVATPGNTGKQRLGQSTKPDPSNPRPITPPGPAPWKGPASVDY